MSSYILTSASHITCIHGGRFHHHPSYTPGILIEGSPMCREGDVFYINCPVQDLCSSIRWQFDLTGIKYLGKPILTTSSRGDVFSSKGLITGMPVLVSFQTKVTLKSLIDAFKQKK